MASYPRQAQPAGGAVALPSGPTPGVSVGVCSSFNEDDRRWQCTVCGNCPMHSRKGSKIVLVIKVVSFALQLCIASLYYWRQVQEVRYERFYNSLDEQVQPMDYTSIYLAYALVIGLSVIVVYIPLALAAWSVWKREKRWMLWPCIIVCGLTAAVTAFALNPFALVDILCTIVVYRFEQYLKHKQQTHQTDAANVYVAAAPTCTPQPQMIDQLQEATGGYVSDGPPNYEDALLAPKPPKY